MTKFLINEQAFTELALNEQLNLLQKHGAYIGKRKLGNIKIMLFQLSGFYVEVQYKKYRKEVHQLLSSENVNVLDAYLDQVNIKGFEN